ncbi:MAG TPA: dihydrofolate reductase family protein [Polyangiaceae bacterium]
MALERPSSALVVAGMTMSLDGYVADANGGTSQLYADLAQWRHSEGGRASIAATGAVVMGRKTFEMAADADAYADTYEYQVPIFVLTSCPPARVPKENSELSFTFVTDGLEGALDQARAAAKSRQVTVVGGATLIQGLLRSSLIDVLEVDVMPVLLGGGLRLFGASTTPILFRRLSVDALPHGRTHLRYAMESSQPSQQ